jgi:hypothetical protein
VLAQRLQDGVLRSQKPRHARSRAGNVSCTNRVDAFLTNIMHHSDVTLRRSRTLAQF